MAKLGRLLIAAVAAGSLCKLWSASFVPGPACRGPDATAAAVAALGVAPSAYADKIDDAAAKLTKSAYPLLKSVKWNDDYFLSLPGAKPGQVAKAIAKTLEMGAAMDGKAVKEGVKAHSAAIAAIGKDGVTSEKAFQKINAAIGHMIASAGEARTMEVYEAWQPLVPAAAPSYLQGKVKAPDAEAAYKALMDFKDVVKAETKLAPAPEPRTYTDKIDEAARSLSEASYPLVRDVDWNAGYFNKLPGSEPQKVLKAIQKALDQGEKMDWAYLQEGALAHAKAIGNVNAKGVLPLDDFVAINAAIGHMISSSGKKASMDTYQAFKSITPFEVPNYQFNMVNAVDAKTAYNALMRFKDVVKGPEAADQWSSSFNLR